MKRFFLTSVLLCVALAIPADAGALSFNYDTSFGHSGSLILEPIAKNHSEEVIGSTTERPSGKTLLMTKSGPILDGAVMEHACSQIVVRRFDVDGTPDPTYGANGVFASTFSGSAACPTSITSDASGRAVGSGFSLRGSSKQRSRERFVFRLSLNGKLDRSFAADGIREFGSGTWGSDENWNPVAVATSRVVVSVGRQLKFLHTDGSTARTVRFKGKIATRVLDSDSRGRVYLAVRKLVKSGKRLRSVLLIHRFNKLGKLDLGYGETGTIRLRSIDQTRETGNWITRFIVGPTGNSLVDSQTNPGGPHDYVFHSDFVDASGNVKKGPGHLDTSAIADSQYMLEFGDSGMTTLTEFDRRFRRAKVSDPIASALPFWPTLFTFGPDRPLIYFGVLGIPELGGEPLNGAGRLTVKRLTRSG